MFSTIYIYFYYIYSNLTYIKIQYCVTIELNSLTRVMTAHTAQIKLSKFDITTNKIGKTINTLYQMEMTPERW